MYIRQLLVLKFFLGMSIEVTQKAIRNYHRAAWKDERSHVIYELNVLTRLGLLKTGQKQPELAF